MSTIFSPVSNGWPWLREGYDSYLLCREDKAGDPGLDSGNNGVTGNAEISSPRVWSLRLCQTLPSLIQTRRIGEVHRYIFFQQPKINMYNI